MYKLATTSKVCEDLFLGFHQDLNAGVNRLRCRRKDTARDKFHVRVQSIFFEFAEQLQNAANGLEYIKLMGGTYQVDVLRYFGSSS